MEAQIAYFSAEFGINPSLPIYSGGLGVLAGDHVKAANDLNIPLIGVGIFYKKGYFRQVIRADGTQEAHYPELHPENLPIKPALDPNGFPVIIQVPIAERTVSLRVWIAEAGNVPVYLMDADHDLNSESDRQLTSLLYGGNQDVRICQEIILGIGGVRLLRQMGHSPDVWHMNEGHSAFLTLERIREYSAQGEDFETALEAVKASTVFTTHTPVPAGHDQFPVELVDRYLGHYYWQLGTTRENILALGLIHGQFNMTRLAVNTSAKVNGVSKLHADVTKSLFHQWNPQIPAQHISVDSITNGIHTKTWMAEEIKTLLNGYLHPTWESRISEMKLWEGVQEIPDEELWDAHQEVKKKMIQQLGLSFSEDVLVIGFARRFATYKRALLAFRDMERLERLVNDQHRPVIFLYAGKAHPADQPGQDLIRRVFEISRMETFKDRIFMLENYDIKMAKLLVSGVDVWLNTPIKPMEASGTSGQKAAINGVLNFSVLDGWWNEGYTGKNGWAIEGGKQSSREEQDQADSQIFYQLLEQEIVPRYYGDRSAWIQMMKESIQSLTPMFSTSCMLAEYWGKLYIPTAIRGRRFSENGLEIARRVASFKTFIREKWGQVRIQSIDLVPAYSGVSIIHCKVDLGEIWHKDVRVEAVGSDLNGGVWKRELQYVKSLEHGVCLFSGSFAGSEEEWNRTQANVRVFPVSPDFNHDFELELVCWGK